MKRLAVLAVLLLSATVAAPLSAAGTVEEVTFFSDALGMERSPLVYLPEGYESSSDSYPVIYFIGNWMAGGPGAWLSSQPGDHHEQLDEMIGDGLIDPVIFVEVDPNAQPWAPDFPARVPAFMTDSELTDLNGDGRTDLDVLFDTRQVLAAATALGIPAMQRFDVTVEGETEDEWFLAATDSLRWNHFHQLLDR